MGVAVNKARHHDASRSVDFDRLARRRQILHAARRPDFPQNAIAHQQRPILDDVKLVEFSPPPGGLGTAQSDQLTRAPD